MAVATHVSRVAKEYAPFGYSVMEDVIVHDGAGAARTAVADLVITYHDDVDVYIEAAEFFASSGLAGGGDKFDISIQYADNTGALANKVAITTALSTASMTNVVFNDLVVSSPVVPAGKIVILTLSNETGTASVTDMIVKLRLRRKA